MTQLPAERKARLAARAAQDKRATDLTVLDVRGISSVTDYFLVCSGRSTTHVETIVDAVRALVRERVDADGVDEAAIAARMYAPDIPDPDLFIRTGGELRVSNFLLWQVAYAEMWATPVLWPDFSVRDLDEALAAYASRERRFGR